MSGRFVGMSGCSAWASYRDNDYVTRCQKNHFKTPLFFADLYTAKFMKYLAIPQFKHQLKRQLKNPQSQHSQGFTLLEILVAIVVLSFGLLGMVGIQAMALKSNSDAKQQSTAVQLGVELSEMMRGNKGIAVKLTTAENPYLILDYIANETNIPAPTQYCDRGDGCTSALNVAQWEMSDWLTRVNDAFPGVRVQVCQDDTPYDGNGLPQFGCVGTSAFGKPISIKIGWTRQSTNSDRSTDASGNKPKAFNDGSERPSVIYLVTPGSSV
jgi:type IV pilus assembly protein PilV